MGFLKKRPGSRRESRDGGRFEMRIIQWFGLFIVLSFTATILFKLLHEAHSSHSRNSGIKHRLASVFTLNDLYGRDKWPASTNGPSQILVLSYPHCGAPMLTRMLMLMGAFAGFSTELAIDGSRYSGWELMEVNRLNTVVMTKNSRPGLPLWMGVGFNASRLSSSDKDYYMDRMKGVVRYLNPKQPWALQDSKLAWLASLWMERLESPMCIVLYRAPAAVAHELSQMQLQGVAADTSYQLHVERWTQTMVESLKACTGVPTLIFPYLLLTGDYIEPGAALLLHHLQLAGVESLSLPTYKQLESQYEKPFEYWQQPLPQETHNMNISSDFGSLQSQQDWIDLESGDSSNSGSRSSSSSGGSGGGAGGAAGLGGGSWPTEALVLDSVLRDHIRDVLPLPSHQHKYSRVAGEVYHAYQTRLAAVRQKLRGAKRVSSWFQAHMRQ